jgi:hypothetical protein
MNIFRIDKNKNLLDIQPTILQALSTGKLHLLFFPHHIIYSSIDVF